MHSKTLVPESLTIRKVAETMVRRNIGSVLVVSGNKEAGMLTERDILSKVVARGLDPNALTAKEVMTTPLITIGDDATIWDAAELMASLHIRRLPVTGKKGEIIGILTTRSISDALPVISRFGESRRLLSSLKGMKHKE